MAHSVGYLMAAAGPLVMGAVREQTGSWTVALSVVIAVALAQLVLGLFAGRSRFVGSSRRDRGGTHLPVAGRHID